MHLTIFSSTITVKTAVSTADKVHVDKSNSLSIEPGWKKQTILNHGKAIDKTETKINKRECECSWSAGNNKEPAFD
jgi:hypothetical protein